MALTTEQMEEILMSKTDSESLIEACKKLGINKDNSFILDKGMPLKKLKMLCLELLRKREHDDRIMRRIEKNSDLVDHYRAVQKSAKFGLDLDLMHDERSILEFLFYQKHDMKKMALHSCENGIELEELIDTITYEFLSITDISDLYDDKDDALTQDYQERVRELKEFAQNERSAALLEVLLFVDMLYSN